MIGFHFAREKGVNFFHFDRVPLSCEIEQAAKFVRDSVQRNLSTVCTMPHDCLMSDRFHLFDAAIVEAGSQVVLIPDGETLEVFRERVTAKLGAPQLPARIEVPR